MECSKVVDEDERQADRDQQILQEVPTSDQNGTSMEFHSKGPWTFQAFLELEACLPVSGAPLPPSAGPPKERVSTWLMEKHIIYYILI